MSYTKQTQNPQQQGQQARQAPARNKVFSRPPEVVCEAKQGDLLKNTIYDRVSGLGMLLAQLNPHATPKMNKSYLSRLLSASRDYARDVYLEIERKNSGG